MISRRGLLAFIGLGAVAQLAEHLPRKQTVIGQHESSDGSGSIPSGTSIRPPLPEWCYRLPPYVQNRLLLVQKGMPIDMEIIPSSFDLPNWGTIDGLTVKEKVRKWAAENLKRS